jgi:hypothetical protein
MAARAGHVLAVRYPGASEAINLPFHPSGSFYLCELPGDGRAMLRLQPGRRASRVSATLDGKVIEMRPSDAAEVLMLQLRGTAPSGPASEGSLEDRIIRADAASFVARTDGEKQAAFNAAKLALEACIARFAERHGRPAAALEELTAIPGAVCASTPQNPYAQGEALGREKGPAPKVTVVYDAAAGTLSIKP